MVDSDKGDGGVSVWWCQERGEERGEIKGAGG